MFNSLTVSIALMIFLFSFIEIFYSDLIEFVLHWLILQVIEQIDDLKINQYFDLIELFFSIINVNNCVLATVC